MALTAPPGPPVLRIPGHVHAAEAPHGGMVLLNARSGQWFAMNGTAGGLWTEWQRTGDFESAVRTTAARYPRAGDDRVRRDAEQLAAELLARGLLVPTAPRRSPRHPREAPPGGAAARSHEKQNRERDPERDPGLEWDQDRRRHRVIGVLGLILALCLLRFPFRIAPKVVSALKRRRAGQPAGLAQAESVLAAVRRVGRRHPGRVACLEHSLGTVLALGLAGFAADWCLGYAEDPYRFHAWVEAAGEHVSHPDDLDRGPFRRVLAL